MYRIVVSDHFKRQLKKLAKKDQHLKDKVIDSLEAFPRITNTPIGERIFKLRLKGHQSGKSGGYRVYIFILQEADVLTPLCIYSKSTKESLRSKELEAHLRAVESELKD